MVGQLSSGQDRLFYSLNLEDHIPTNHRLRSIDRCLDLSDGEGFAVDASIIKADASRQHGVPGDEEINWRDPSLSTRAVREYLEALDEEALAEALPKRLSLPEQHCGS
ncbi:hypothetical protein [Pseudomonas huanghezhanensis]